MASILAHVARHAVERPSGKRGVFEPELTDLGAQVLRRAGVPRTGYMARRPIRCAAHGVTGRRREVYGERGGKVVVTG